MKQYLDALKAITDKGNTRGDRTGTGTRSIFGLQQEYDLAAGFPLVTTKKVNLRAIIEELLWFLKGSTDNNELTAKNVHIWDEWALPDGRLGPIYGKQWRHWETTRVTDLQKKDLTDGQLVDAIVERLEIGKIGRQAHSDAVTAITSSMSDVVGGLRTIEQHIELRKQIAIRNGVTPHVLEAAQETVVVDQIAELIKGLKEKPNSRRHIVNAWNVTDLPNESIKPQANVLEGRMALAPCHTMFQFYTEDLSLAEMLNITPAHVRKELVNRMSDEEPRFVLTTDEDKRQWLGVYAGVPRMRLSCKLYQRSSDFCVGVPFNIASYALLTMMVAQCVGMVPGKFIHTHGDAHVYAPHLEGAREQLKRTPHKLPTMKINPKVKDIDGFTIDDFELVGYVHDDPIKYDIAI